MKRVIAYTLLSFALSGVASGEPVIADIHTSAKTPNAFVRTGPARGGRYEIKTATMVDLVRIAYGFDADKVVGGPNWLEMDHFDVIAKGPADSTPDSQKAALQTILEDRFKLKVHKDVRPLPTYALTVGKKLQLKEADGTEETGCKLQTSSGPAAEGGLRLTTTDASGKMTVMTLGPGMTLQYNCRNMTMAAFAGGLRGMMGAQLGPNPVIDETELKGGWNFDVKWSLGLIGPMMASQGERITVFDAVEKQLGLRLTEKQIPTPVMVVDSVNRTPTANPPEVAEALPAIPIPTEFEVADVKPTDPATRMGRFNMMPGGRVVVQGMSMRFLIGRAFNSSNNEEIVGLPKWADSERFDITAKTSTTGAAIGPMDMDAIAPMMLSLLKDRFKLTYHTEEKPVSAYSLMSAKPKMKKADAASRTYCRNGNAPAGAPPGSRVLTCQNITMAQFAERLRNASLGLGWPIADATGIEGGWDFTLVFSPNATMFNGPMVPGRAGGEGGEPIGASDPSGVVTIFQALEKQLGLKLESQKRTLPVIVIDHIEQKATEN